MIYIKLKKEAQSAEYLSKLNIAPELIDIVLKSLSDLDGRNKKNAIRYVKKNVELINGKKDEILKSPSDIFSTIGFVPKEAEIKIDDNISGLFQNVAERRWVQILFNDKKIFEEDFLKIKNLLISFSSIPNRPALNSFASDEELFDYVDSNLKKEPFKYPESGYEVVDKGTSGDNDIVLIRVFEESAMKQIGKNTNWCVSHGAWSGYSPPEFYCFIIDEEPEVLLHQGSRQIKDSSDATVSGNLVYLIRHLVDKHQLLTGKGRDFEVFADVSEEIDSVREELDVSGSFLPTLERNINHIDFASTDFIKDHIDEVIPLIKFINFETLSNRVKEIIGEYVNFNGLEERKYLDYYALSSAAKNKSNYLKDVPKSLRSGESNLLFKLDPTDDRAKYLKYKAGIFSHGEIDPSDKDNPELFDAWISGLVSGLVHDRTRINEDQIDDELKNEEDILSAWRQGWLISLSQFAWDLFQIPKSLADDPKILEARRLGWIKSVGKYIKMTEDIPDDLKDDLDVKRASRKCWIDYVYENPFGPFPHSANDYLRRGDGDVPSEFDDDSFFEDSWRHGVINYLKSGQPTLENGGVKIPNRMLKDKEVIDLYRKRVIYELSDYKHSFAAIPHMFRNNQNVIEAWDAGRIKELQEVSLDMLELYKPDGLEESEGLMAEWKSKWIEKLEQSGLNMTVAPTDFWDDPDIIEAWKRGWMKTLSDMGVSENSVCDTFFIPRDVREEFNIRAAKNWYRIVKT